jgi:hypothetical protein
MKPLSGSRRARQLRYDEQRLIYLTNTAGKV